MSHLRRALTPQGTLVIIGGEGGGRWFGGVDLQFMKELIEAGKVTPVIDRTYPLTLVPEAIRYLGAGRARGKVVITV